MGDDKYILGIDTSNYTTSVAVLNGRSIAVDLRRLLDVRQGDRGLRQSDAVFQHMKNLPELFEELRQNYKGEISAVAYSSRPRPVNGSYMPCFLAGESFARTIGTFLQVPVIGFSHQEGHIEAIRAFSEMKYMDEYLACHFSGGTCEILKITPASIDRRRTVTGGYSTFSGENTFYDIEIIGGSKDISFGQVLDRAGVMMGFSFPCGEEMDEIACSCGKTSNMLTPVKVTDTEVNLSGIDTQIKNKINSLSRGVSPSAMDIQLRDEFIREIMTKISDAMAELLVQASGVTGLKDIIMSGGVSTSRFIRREISGKLEKMGIIVYFDDMNLSSDNAVGTALLGGEYIWD